MSRDDRTPQEGQTYEVQESPLPSLRAILGALVLGLLVLFLLQNLQKTEIHFLWFDWKTRIVFALLASSVFGALATWLFSTFRGWAQRRRERQLYEAARRR